MGEMLGNIGPLEIIVVLIIALVVFGPKRLPELGNSLGKGIREFKQTVTGEKDDDADDDVKTLSATQATTAAPVETPAEAEVAPDKRG
jgi:sec-independent protein translocase protein TatA